MSKHKRDPETAEYYAEAYDADGDLIWHGVIEAQSRKSAISEAKKHFPKGARSFSVDLQD